MIICRASLVATMDVIPAKPVPARCKPGAGIQKGTGFPRIKYGAGVSSPE